MTLLGGAAAAWPLAARAQQGERMRRVGVLIPGASDDPISQARLAAFLEGLQQLGWVDGRNVHIDTRLGASDADLLRKHAGELVALGPDVVMAYSSNDVWASLHRKLIITLAAQHKLPAVYNTGYYATDGGLIGYGPDYSDLCRRAAGYVDRILKGEKPANLPVQAPTKYQLVINLKTAKALGLEIPATVLARADEVIE